MPRAITAEQQTEFDRFVEGEVFRSEPPIQLAVFDPADLQVIKEHEFAMSYSTRNLSSDSEGVITNTEVLAAILRATSLFSKHGYGPPITRFSQLINSGIHTRYGMFVDGMPRSVDISGFHLDSNEGISDDGFEAVAVTAAVIGAPTMAFYGLARRTNDEGDVELLDGEVDHLENGIYLFPPTAAHSEALLPETPEARFFWRKFHD